MTVYAADNFRGRWATAKLEHPADVESGDQGMIIEVMTTSEPHRLVVKWDRYPELIVIDAAQFGFLKR